GGPRPPLRARRQRRWIEPISCAPVTYATRRRALLKLICPTRRCHHCQAKAPSWSALEIDHLDGKGWVSNKVNSTQRLRIMERELAAGARLVGSCGHCNHSSGATRRYKWKTRRRRNRGGVGYSRYAIEYAKYIAAQAERE